MSAEVADPSATVLLFLLAAVAVEIAAVIDAIAIRARQQQQFLLMIFSPKGHGEVIPESP